MEFWFHINGFVDHLGGLGVLDGGGTLGVSLFPEFLTKNLYHEIELYTLMTTLRFF